jgi:hypothetical protein
MILLQDRETGVIQRKPIGAIIADRIRAVGIGHLDSYAGL